MLFNTSQAALWCYTNADSGAHTANLQSLHALVVFAYNRSIVAAPQHDLAVAPGIRHLALATHLRDPQQNILRPCALLMPLTSPLTSDVQWHDPSSTMSKSRATAWSIGTSPEERRSYRSKSCALKKTQYLAQAHATASTPLTRGLPTSPPCKK